MIAIPLISLGSKSPVAFSQEKQTRNNVAAERQKKRQLATTTIVDRPTGVAACAIRLAVTLPGIAACSRKFGAAHQVFLRALSFNIQLNSPSLTCPHADALASNRLLRETHRHSVHRHNYVVVVLIGAGGG
jgi:hypothetical protein